MTSFGLRRLRRRGRSSSYLTRSRLGLLSLTVGFGILGLAGIGVSLRLQSAVYLIGMVAMNLPQGGYENLHNLDGRGTRFQMGYIASYVLTIAAFTAVFFFDPVVGLGLGVFVAMAKGGFGDLSVLETIYGDHIKTDIQRWLAAAVRGGVVMVVPMAFHPEAFYGLSSVMVNIFDPGGLTRLGYGSFETASRVLGAVLCAITGVYLVLGYIRSDATGSFRSDAGEIFLLVAYFAVTPVVVAVGLYFPLWYSARQVARMRAVDDSETERDGFDAPAVVVSLVVASVVLGGLVWSVSPQPLGGARILPGLVAFWTVFVSIIALPHVVIGGLIDRSRGIWYVP
ncbi:Brp/Blh family beta-carotene 15,15'-dioxygenase [Halorutilales archaeon Cl-col2-1]